MSNVKIQFLGYGDRLQSCILLRTEHDQFVIDCGASLMIGINRCGINPNNINGILIFHLHGDHFGVIPFFIVASQFIYKRMAPLRMLGPPAIKE